MDTHKHEDHMIIDTSKMNEGKRDALEVAEAAREIHWRLPSFGTKMVLAEFQRKGRWRAPQSVRRYEKGGRRPQQLAKLDPVVRGRAAQAAQHLPEIVSGRRSPFLWPSL